MKIVFVGNSGSGKTTLAERIALSLNEAMCYANLKDYPLPEKDDGFDLIVEKQEAIRYGILYNIVESESGCFDRSVFDEYCYTNRYLGECLSSLNAEKIHNDYADFLKRALAHLKQTRLLLKREAQLVENYFYCEPLANYIKENQITFEYVEKKKRFGDLTLQEIYDIMRYKILPKEKMVVVPAMGLEERVEFVMGVLNGKTEG